MNITVLHSLFAAFLLLSSAHQAAAVDVTARPRITVIERDGITGGGQAVVSGTRAMIVYPNHPDDFGGTAGTGASESMNDSTLWARLPDDWPLPKMVDLWIDKLSNGDLLAFGIHWVPDSKKRGELTIKDVPADAYTMSLSKDQGRTWASSPATFDYGAELGVIARPLPHIIEDENGALLMPAYSWGKTGNRSLVLKSTDQGRRWSVLSTITSAAEMVKAGAPVTTPWLETSIAITKDHALLAIVRTGSSASASLMSVRSTDQGQSWSSPEKLPIIGKLPTLQLMPNGVLALLTAHSKDHTRLYVSADGTGRQWSDGFIITSQSGGNAGMCVAGENELLIVTPANRRIDSWHVKIQPSPPAIASLAAPSKIDFTKGMLTWEASAGAVAYRIKPILITPGPSYPDAEILPHATIQTSDAITTLDFSRQLLIGGTYVFEISAVDKQGRVSAATRSTP